ncbi:hypothetical protein C2S52_018979 [Perilla frutescens var. hirtella]|nr:hypothetical protein C2S52_018979 [Perilla frutescens var. hirtella]KAH6806695.1 hypothetical protein C2S51_031526 [Perilla frutescens var. frutescens]
MSKKTLGIKSVELINYEIKNERYETNPILVGLKLSAIDPKRLSAETVARSKSGRKAVSSFCNGPEFRPPAEVLIGLD